MATRRITRLPLRELTSVGVGFQTTPTRTALNLTFTKGQCVLATPTDERPYYGALKDWLDRQRTYLAVGGNP